MTRVLAVDDSFSGQQTLVLAGAGGRNQAVSAVPPNSVAPDWASVLAAGNRSGVQSPILNFTILLRFSGDFAGASQAGFIGVVAGDLVFASEESNAVGPVNILIRATDSVAGNGASITLRAGSGPLGNGLISLDAPTSGTMITVDDGGISFFGGTPAISPVIVGSRGGNVALANLLSNLANMGLITDNTTP